MIRSYWPRSPAWAVIRLALCSRRRMVGETHEQAAHRLLESVGVRADICGEWQTIRHAVTRFRITMVCFEARYRSGRFASPFYAAGRWLRPCQFGGFPLSTPQRRLLQ